EMTLNYYGFDDPGAWGASEPTTHTSKRCRVYRTFKLIQGPGGSDDHGVWLRRCGAGNEVSGNHIYAGLIGVSVGDSTDVEVHHNVIHGMSSIGVLTSEDARRGAVDLRVHDNLIYDCNLNIRLHHYNNCLPDARREYFYRNVSWQRPGMGGHIFVHWTSKEITEGCEPPPLYLYHNTFAGGRRGFTTSGWADDDGGNPGIWLLNNIIGGDIALYGSSPFMAGPEMMGPVDHNWIIGPVNHGDAAWLGEHNVTAPEAPPWPADSIPDFALAEDSPARGIALDLSQPFEVMGRPHDALPGMQPGYFAGDAPDAGAVQFGEEVPVAPR
ncbi:MAG: hypothetical protein GF393_02250, partial [Armatimonadia bacterium]|nr:hypothetical protein [Armatimonadia bacterium]